MQNKLAAGALVAFILVSAARSAAQQPTPNIKELNRILFPTRTGPNKIHQMLLKMSAAQRAKAFDVILKRERCGGVTETFFQGSAPNGDASWSARCLNGSAYSVGIEGGREGDVRVMDCAVGALVGVDCFKKFK